MLVEKVEFSKRGAWARVVVLLESCPASVLVPVEEKKSMCQKNGSLIFVFTVKPVMMGDHWDWPYVSLQDRCPLMPEAQF